MSASVHELIDGLGLNERTDDYTDRPHADLWAGSGVVPSIRMIGEGIYTLGERLPADARTVEEWDDYPYRVVWRVPSERAHVTYCEGDVSVLIARSDEDFAAIERSADRFYAP
jgi:hypothetical protein